jgi:hypothetical protein
MIAARSRASASIRIAIVSLVVGALAFASSGSSGAVKAQAPKVPPGLEAQKDRLLSLFQLAGVVFTDVDETSGRLVVGVLDRDVEGVIRASLPGLGVSSQSVDVVEAPAILQIATLRDKVRPVVGGLQIRFSQYLCSLGFNALRDGVSGYVTASHCSDRQGDVDGTEYYQPLNQVADEFIGTEIADPAFLRGGSCPRGKKCRRSDANFSRADSGAESAAGLGDIAKTTGANNGSLDIAGQFSITGNGAAVVGQTANKVGRTTGWTAGSVTRTCVDTAVAASNILLLCQDFVEVSGRRQPKIVGPGDSGSPVFRIVSGDNVTLLGGLWGGDSSGSLFVYSPIANIQEELGALITH